MSKNIQIRIDEKTKRGAKKVLDELGLDMSSAIKIYLKQIVITESIPLNLVTENGLTPAQEKQILKAQTQAEKNKNTTKEMSIREAVEYLKS